ncbi:hypothetical protein K2Q08_03165 [Patescibacteria group bacterium]|nr:hypothetical protein [Patescibacteria group bacterium]
MKFSRRHVSHRFLAPALILTVSFVVAGVIFVNTNHVLAGGTLRNDGTSQYTSFTCGGGGYNINTGTYDWSAPSNTCTFACDAAHNGQTCTDTTTVGSGTYPDCTGFTTCAYSVCQTTTYTCVYTEPICVADSSCAATTYTDSTCTDSCGNVYAGTKTYPPPTCASLGYAYGTYPSCSNTPPYAQGYYQATYAPTYSEGYYQGYYQATYAPSYSEASYYSQASDAPQSCTSPTVTLTANPVRVKSGQTTSLKITGTGITTSCVVTGPGVSQTIPASTCNATATITTPAITSSSKYSVTCDGVAASAFVIVNTSFKPIEF